MLRSLVGSEMCIRDRRNPARWAGHFKEAMVGSEKLKPKHLPAMPYPEIPAFIKQLQKIGSVAAKALEFTILTAARSGETLGSLWSEIDFEEALWTIPASRMKNGFEHNVPLTPRVLEILREMHEVRMSDYIFPGMRPHLSLIHISEPTRLLSISYAVFCL